MTGILIIIIAGALLHFVYEWSGEIRPVGIIAGVNESVWEHLKIAFWPAFFYGLIEFFNFGKYLKSFVFAKSIGIFIMPVTIVVLFYLYTAVIEDALVWDILIFVIAVILGQITSYRIIKSGLFPEWTTILGAILIVVMIAAFSTLTYFAFQNPLFIDSETGGYGFP